MAFAKGAGNFTISYNSVALAGYAASADIDAAVKELDTTVLTSTGQTKIPGVANFTLNLAGNYDVAVDNAIAPDVITPPTTLRTVVVVYGPSGSTVTLTWTTNAFVQSYKVTTTPTDLMKWTAVVAVSGVPVRS